MNTLEKTVEQYEREISLCHSGFDELKNAVLCLETVFEQRRRAAISLKNNSNEENALIARQVIQHCDALISKTLLIGPLNNK